VLTVACVNWGPLYDPKYVRILEKAVKKNLAQEHEFVCFTDKPENYTCRTRTLPKGLKGWWNKLYLFSPGCFDGRALYLDLDVCITGSLDSLVDVPSKFCIIDDWHLDGYNSSVFVMDKDAHPEVWEDFNSTEGFPGDQDWISHKVPHAAVFPSQWCVSYRSHAQLGVPRGTKVVVFHGTPKPHELPSYWVKNYWHE
jgi:hypothetical protein